jgi:hypothetical protein
MAPLTTEQKVPTISEMEADRIAAVVNDANYQQTIGKWLKDLEDYYLHCMMEEEGLAMERAKGAFKALNDIKDQITLVMAKRDGRARRRQQEIANEEN